MNLNLPGIAVLITSNEVKIVFGLDVIYPKVRVPKNWYHWG